MLDPKAPLPDISADEPAGPNLEFDAAFSEFERNSQGKPEQQYGSTVVPAEEPEWKDVISSGWALLERTYDLRVVATLAVARLQREGMVGYTETLALARQMLESRWEQVHPQLDPEDDNDPTLRANALLAIGEAARVLRFMRTMPLARSPRAGVISWRDISIATGALDVDDGTPKLTETVISAAFRETDASALAALREAVAEAIGHAVAIPAAFDESAGYGTGPDYAELLKMLREIQRFMTTYTPAVVEDFGEEPAAAEAVDGQAPDMVARPRAGNAVSIATLGPVTNRADAVRLLDLVIEYYERNEPSSPLPLLVGRARRMADKGFLDLIRDLAPDGFGQVERIVGSQDQ